MRKRVLSALMAFVMIVGLFVVPAYAAGISATVTATIQDGGYYQGNSFGDASMSNGLRGCKWMCMEPDGNPPQPGHSFSAEEAGGMYRTFAWMAQEVLSRNPHPAYPSSDWERLWKIQGRSRESTLHLNRPPAIVRIERI